jgi:small subunit ribosomal protein S21
MDGFRCVPCGVRKPRKGINCVIIILLISAASRCHCVACFYLFVTTARPATELAVKIKIVVGDGEPIESALRRFKREVNKSGHLMELRHKRYFENSQEKAIRKVKEARMRVKFERMQRRRMAQRT